MPHAEAMTVFLDFNDTLFDNDAYNRHDMAAVAEHRQQMNTLIDDLHTQGHKVGLCTTEVFDEMQSILSGVKREKFDVVIENMAKKKPESYQRDEFKDNKHILVVDDQTSNIRVAAEAGVGGIVFQSPLQLREELVQRQILAPNAL